MQSPGTIQTDIADGIATIFIENSRKQNALTVAMWQALREAVTNLASEDACRCIIIRGGGETAFASGADITEFQQQRSSHEQVTRYHESYVLPAVKTILDCPIPILAAVKGACIGGGLEIASACDIRVASEDAKFGVPIQRMGFPLGYGETELLFKLYGRGVATDLLLAARIYSATEALHAGIVQYVVPSPSLSSAVTTIAKRIVGFSPLAARETKAQISRLMRDWTPVSEAERQASYKFGDSADYWEGYRAFLEKRTPRFTGR